MIEVTRRQAVPGADSTTNVVMRDVVGNKSDVAGHAADEASLIGLARHGIAHLEHISEFTGELWYVAKSGNDSNDGKHPGEAFLTIDHAVDSAGIGDAIAIKTGTYTENVTADLAGLEIWAEIGAVLVGTLTVSADACFVTNLIVAPSGAIGVALTGNRCVFRDVKVVGTPTTAWDIDGYQNIIYDSKAVGYTVTAFDVANYNTHLARCIAQGAEAGTRGFYLSAAAAARCTIENCISIGNDTAGYEIITGCEHNTILNCSSGGGDGRWVDADMENVWSGFMYDDIAMKTLTFSAAGGASANLFRVYGTVLVTEFFGCVSTVLAGDVGNGYVRLFDGANAIDITDSPGPSFNSLPEESYIHKVDDAGVNIALENSSQVRMYEDATKFGEDPHFQITAKDGAPTYLQFTYSGTGSTGAIHWHCQWRPLTPNGFVATA